MVFREVAETRLSDLAFPSTRHRIRWDNPGRICVRINLAWTHTSDNLLFVLHAAWSAKESTHPAVYNNQRPDMMLSSNSDGRPWH